MTGEDIAQREYERVRHDCADDESAWQRVVRAVGRMDALDAAVREDAKWYAMRQRDTAYADAANARAAAWRAANPEAAAEGDRRRAADESLRRARLSGRGTPGDTWGT